MACGAQACSRPAAYALATIRDQDKRPMDFQVVDLNVGAAQLLQQPIEALRWRRLSEGNHAFNSALVSGRLRKIVETGKRETFEVMLGSAANELCLNVSLTSMGDLICAALTDITELKQRERSSRPLVCQRHRRAAGLRGHYPVHFRARHQPWHSNHRRRRRNGRTTRLRPKAAARFRAICSVRQGRQPNCHR
jgi:hypothetical protein